jgi:hypothetical protein
MRRLLHEGRGGRGLLLLRVLQRSGRIPLEDRHGGVIGAASSQASDGPPGSAEACLRPNPSCDATGSVEVGGRTVWTSRL